MFTPALTTVNDITERRKGGRVAGDGSTCLPGGAHTRQIPARTTVTDVTERRKGGGKYPRPYNRRRLGVAVVKAGSAVVHRTNAVDGKGAASEDILTRMHVRASSFGQIGVRLQSEISTCYMCPDSSGQTVSDK